MHYGFKLLYLFSNGFSIYRSDISLRNSAHYNQLVISSLMGIRRALRLKMYLLFIK